MLDPLDARYSHTRAWLSAVLLSATLLVLPLLTWVLVPSPGDFSPPDPPRVHVAVAATMPARSSTAHAEAAPLPSAARVAPSAIDVAGIVLDPEGKPASKASVGCQDRDTELATSADAEGRFTLPAKAAGCLVVARHPDFISSEPTAIPAGRANTIRLRAPGGIDGVVVDEKGNPIATYVLAIESFMAAGESPEAVPPRGPARSFQDTRGEFLWEGLRPGKYVLTASSAGRPPSRSAQIDVEAARVTRRVRLVLPKGARLSGKVLDAETHKPVVGAEIALDAVTSTTANSIGSVRSEESGAYALEGAPAGPFSIRVTSEKYRTRTISGLTTHDGAPLVHDVELTSRGDAGASDEMSGIGAALVQQAGGVGISWVLPSGPAEAAGLQLGDLISRIDGVDARGLAVVDCIQRLRGPDGSRVALVVTRPGTGTVEVGIVRKNIVR